MTAARVRFGVGLSVALSLLIVVLALLHLFDHGDVVTPSATTSDSIASREEGESPAPVESVDGTRDEQVAFEVSGDDVDIQIRLPANWSAPGTLRSIVHGKHNTLRSKSYKLSEESGHCAAVELAPGEKALLCVAMESDASSMVPISSMSIMERMSTGHVRVPDAHYIEREFNALLQTIPEVRKWAQELGSHYTIACLGSSEKQGTFTLPVFLPRFVSAHIVTGDGDDLEIQRRLFCTQSVVNGPATLRFVSDSMKSSPIDKPALFAIPDTDGLTFTLDLPLALRSNNDPNATSGAIAGHLKEFLPHSRIEFTLPGLRVMFVVGLDPQGQEIGGLRTARALPKAPQSTDKELRVVVNRDIPEFVVYADGPWYPQKVAFVPGTSRRNPKRLHFAPVERLIAVRATGDLYPAVRVEFRIASSTAGDSPADDALYLGYTCSAVFESRTGQAVAEIPCPGDAFIELSSRDALVTPAKARVLADQKELSIQVARHARIIVTQGDNWPFKLPLGHRRIKLGAHWLGPLGDTDAGEFDVTTSSLEFEEQSTLPTSLSVRVPPGRYVVRAIDTSMPAFAEKTVEITTSDTVVNFQETDSFEELTYNVVNLSGIDLAGGGFILAGMKSFQIVADIRRREASDQRLFDKISSRADRMRENGSYSEEHVRDEEAKSIEMAKNLRTLQRMSSCVEYNQIGRVLESADRALITGQSTSGYFYAAHRAAVLAATINHEEKTITLERLVSLATLQGTVAIAAGSTIVTATTCVTLRTVRSDIDRRTIRPTDFRVPLTESGTFSLESLPPGTYVLRALVADVKKDTEGEDGDSTSINLKPGPALTVTLVAGDNPSIVLQLP